MPTQRRFTIPELVTTYRHGSLIVGHDLAHVKYLLAYGAHEAVIFYCARILEGLIESATDSTGLNIPPQTSRREIGLDRKIAMLRQYRYISDFVASLAQNLRILGNDVRHIRREVQANDAMLSVMYLEQVLNWYFCDFSHGPREQLFIEKFGRFWLGTDNEFQPAIEMMAGRSERLSPELLTNLATTHPVLSGSPAFACVITEYFISRKMYIEAENMLTNALEIFSRKSDTVRLKQIKGLLLSRQGRVEEALLELHRLQEDAQEESVLYEETIGILAGAMKRQWAQSGHKDREQLNRIHGQYGSGWRNSEYHNTYLGINTATTAYWLGHTTDARQIAQDVIDFLTIRKEKKVNHVGNIHLQRYQLDYYDEVTLAEAYLLLEQTQRGQTLYLNAFRRFPGLEGNFEGTKEQARLILEQQGRWDNHFFDLPIAKPRNTPFRIAITGHRRLPEEDQAFHSALNELLAIIRRDQGDGDVIIYSLLAEGADRLVANLLMAQPYNACLKVMLPLPEKIYIETFQSPNSAADFATLLQQADEIFPPAWATSSLPKAYKMAGQNMIDRCDALIALWDGEEGRGEGGTAEILEYARAQGKIIYGVFVAPPYDYLLPDL